jgi:hypothetical protein
MPEQTPIELEILPGWQPPNEFEQERRQEIMAGNVEIVDTVNDVHSTETGWRGILASTGAILDVICKYHDRAAIPPYGWMHEPRAHDTRPALPLPDRVYLLRYRQPGTRARPHRRPID